MFINYHTQMLQKNMLEAKLTDALVFSGVYFYYILVVVVLVVEAHTIMLLYI